MTKIKGVVELRRELEDSGKGRKGGLERLQCVRGILANVSRLERWVADHPAEWGYWQVHDLRELIGEVQNTINRLEAAQKRRV